MKFKETRIGPGTEIYLLGTARDNPDIQDTTAQTNTEDLIITKANNPYMISNSSEEDLTTCLSKKTLGALGIGLLLTVTGIIFLTQPF